MANASAKRIAAQNEKTTKYLRLGMIVPTALFIFLRLLFRRSSFPPSKSLLAVYVLTYIPSFFITRYLESIGTTKRDPATGTLISSGEDLSQPGVTELCFDILYVTWVCQVGSGAFGDWFWWFYTAIPLYGLYKIFSTFIYPMIKSNAPSAAAEDANDREGQTSKRQEKLRKRSERGDPRVRMSRR